MKLLPRAAAVVAITSALGACGSGQQAADSDPFAPQLRSQIRAEATQLARSLGDSSVTTAEVYGPRSRIRLVKAATSSWVRTSAQQRKGFYLIVVRGHFVCGACSVPPGGKTPRGTVATDIWSRSAGGTDFGLGDDLPRAVARLGKPAAIKLG